MPRGPTLAAMNRAAFLTAYRTRLLTAYTWTSDTGKLERFLSSVTETLAGRATSWNHDGDCVTAAWRDIGGRGRPTLKALRALPAD